MMNKSTVPQDDIDDVKEMTDALEKYMFHVLKDNEPRLSMSALMSATLNSILDQCSSIDEVVFYRNIFVAIFDATIQTIRIKGK